MTQDEFEKLTKVYEAFQKTFQEFAERLVNTDGSVDINSGNIPYAANFAQILMCLHQILSDSRHGRPF